MGIAGIGWQLANVPSHGAHLEAAEVHTARQLKASRAAVRVLASRNTEVVTTLWDSVRAAFADASKEGYWVRDARGRVVEASWVSPAGNT